MVKFKLLSRSAFFFTALVLARPAAATGIGGNGVDSSVPYHLYAGSLSLACWVAYALLRRREPRRASSSLEDRETFWSALRHQDGFFFGAFQIVVTVAASIGVAVEFIPAPFFSILPFAYALIRRKRWLGVGLLVATVVFSLPFFVVLGVMLVSVKFR